MKWRKKKERKILTEQEYWHKKLRYNKVEITLSVLSIILTLVLFIILMEL